MGVCQPFKILGYQLSGEVKSPSGQPMSDVKVTVLNYLSKITTTNRPEGGIKLMKKDTFFLTVVCKFNFAVLFNRF